MAWEVTCKRFSDTDKDNLQDDDKRYFSSCKMSSAKSVKELMALSQTISQLKGKIDSKGQEYSASEADKVVLKQSMKDFCCAMWARREFETRHAEAEEDYKIAKQRVESVRDPPANLSYMGTIVPLGRPLRSDSVPMLLITSLVFLILGLGLLLNIGNVQLAYVGPRSYGPGIFERLIESYRQTSWGVLGITIVLSAAAAGGIFYGIQKTYPEWLNK